MKKFFVILLLVLNVLPVLAYVRDDTNTGGGFFGAIFSKQYFHYKDLWTDHFF